MPTRQHYGETPKYFLGTKHAAVPLVSAYTSTHAVWAINKMSKGGACVCRAMNTWHH